MEESQTIDAGLEVFDAHGERVGKLLEIHPSGLAIVKTGLFGLRSSLVPLAGASVEGGALVVPFDKALIREAPALPKGRERIDPDEESAVYAHYGLGDVHTHP